MPTNTSKEFILPLENKSGAVAEVAAALGKANVNLLGYLLQAQGEFGVFRFVASDPAKAEGWLKESRRLYRTNDVLTVAAPNTPGELGRAAAALSKSGVNITSSYPITLGTGIGIAFAVDDLPGARKALGS